MAALRSRCGHYILQLSSFFIFPRLFSAVKKFQRISLLPADGILPRAKFTLRPSLALSYIGSVRYCTAVQQRASAKLYGVVQGMELRNFCRGRHLCSAGGPSRWASAHTVVASIFLKNTNRSPPPRIQSDLPLSRQHFKKFTNVFLTNPGSKKEQQMEEQTDRQTDQCR